MGNLKLLLYCWVGKCIDKKVLCICVFREDNNSFAIYSTPHFLSNNEYFVKNILHLVANLQFLFGRIIDKLMKLQLPLFVSKI